ncbi:unnamed protein product [Heterotrigona itama]|uniref:Uncharacterized protein n=1 Tax=Heterotrigona itama TaxID=395501 RepID=A0A6V7H1R2_9HYME|nr:unnamed protein product [Heterotrigona itama]
MGFTSAVNRTKNQEKPRLRPIVRRELTWNCRLRSLTRSTVVRRPEATALCAQENRPGLFHSNVRAIFIHDIPTNYCIRFGHSLWSVNQLSAQEVNFSPILLPAYLQQNVVAKYKSSIRKSEESCGLAFVSEILIFNVTDLCRVELDLNTFRAICTTGGTLHLDIVGEPNVVTLFSSVLTNKQRSSDNLCVRRFQEQDAKRRGTSNQRDSRAKEPRRRMKLERNNQKWDLRLNAGNSRITQSAIKKVQFWKAKCSMQINTDDFNLSGEHNPQ